MDSDILQNDKYQIECLIGYGGYAQVYKAKNTINGQIVAIKQIKKRCFEKNPKTYELFKSEVSILKQIKSENAIKFIEQFETTENQFIVIEFCNGGTLAKQLNKVGTFSEEQALSFFLQIVSAFKEIHKYNIMLHYENNVSILKIIDFGFSKIKTELLTQTFIGTQFNMAPEIIESKPYGFEVDVFSFCEIINSSGVILYQMLFGDYPFKEQNQSMMLKAINKGEINFNLNGKQISEEMQDLIRKMLIYNQQDRIKWYMIYDHPAVNRIQGLYQNGNKQQYEQFQESRIQAIQFYKNDLPDVAGMNSVDVPADMNCIDLKNNLQVKAVFADVLTKQIKHQDNKQSALRLSTETQLLQQKEYAFQIQQANQILTKEINSIRNMYLIYIHIKLAFVLARRLKKSFDEEKNNLNIPLFEKYKETLSYAEFQFQVNKDARMFLYLYQLIFVEIQSDIQKQETAFSEHFNQEIQNIIELDQNFKNLFLQILLDQKYQQLPSHIKKIIPENFNELYPENSKELTEKEIKDICGQLQAKYQISFILSFEIYNWEDNFQKDNYSAETLIPNLLMSSDDILYNKFKQVLKQLKK